MSEFESINNSFKLKLYNWRMANGLKLAEAADKLNVSYSSLWAWENRNRRPKEETYARIKTIIEPAQAADKLEDTCPITPVEPKRPLTFRERMEQRHGGPDEYFKKTQQTTSPVEEEPEVEVIAELPLDPPARPTPSLVKLTKVIGFLECLVLYAAEGVAEPLEQQIKTLQDIAEEMSA